MTGPRPILRSPSQASHLSFEPQHAQQQQQVLADRQSNLPGASRAPLSRSISQHSSRTQYSQHQQQQVHKQQWPADGQPNVIDSRSISRTVSQASHHFGDRKQHAQQFSADRWSDMTDARPGSYAGSQTSQYSSWQMQQQQEPHVVTAGIPEPTAYMPKPQCDMPGPGAYDHPSCFLPAYPQRNASSYVLASQVGTSIKGRNWPTPDTSSSCSPGPQAYAPLLEAESAKRTAPKAVFSSANKDNLDKLHLGSEELNRSASRTPSPGPAAYSVGRCRSPGRQSPGPPAGPRATFAPSRFSPQHLTAALAVAARKSSRSPCSRIPCFDLSATQPPADTLSAAISINVRDISGVYRQQPFRPVSCTEFADGHVTDSATKWSRNTNNGTDLGTLDPSDAEEAVEAEADAASPPSKQKLRSKSAGAKAFSSDDCQSSSLGGHAWSFGPPGGVEVGINRRRSQEANVYISSRHTAVDPGGKAAREVPGAGAYDVSNRLQLLSTHKVEGKASFGTAERFATSKAKIYLSADLVKSDPSLACSPGPGTAAADILGTITAATNGALHSGSIGPKFSSPATSNTSKQHPDSKQHEALRAGQSSPGPAAYDVVSAALSGTILGDRRTVCFGRGTAREVGDVMQSSSPGPGAYMVDKGRSSTHASSPAYSLGASVRHGGHIKPSMTPGVGAYSFSSADRQCLPNSGAATLKGKLSHGGIAPLTCGPAPNAYQVFGGVGYKAEIKWMLRWGLKYNYCTFQAAERQPSLHQTPMAQYGHQEWPSKRAMQVPQWQQQLNAADFSGQLALNLPTGLSQYSHCDSFCSRSIGSSSGATARYQSTTDLSSYRSEGSMLSLGNR